MSRSKTPLSEVFGNYSTESARQAPTPLRRDSANPSKTEIEKTEYQKFQDWLKNRLDAVNTLSAYNQLVVDLEQRLSESSLSDAEKQEFKEMLEKRLVKSHLGLGFLAMKDAKQFVQFLQYATTDSSEFTISVAMQESDESKKARISFLVSRGYTQAQAEKYEDTLRSEARGATSVVRQGSSNSSVFKK